MIKLKSKPLDILYETSKFGMRDLVGMWWHNGMDLRATIGTPVYAVADGTVKVSKDNPTGYGLYIVISHGKFGSLYAHLSQYDTLVGQKVKAGQIIGYSGNTGNSAAPHLHFEIRECEYDNFWDRCKADTNVFMRCVDPFPYLNELLSRYTINTTEAKNIVKENAELEDNTIDYLANDYKYGESLIIKLARAIN